MYLPLISEEEIVATPSAKTLLFPFELQSYYLKEGIKEDLSGFVAAPQDKSARHLSESGTVLAVVL